jgi:uncharacterized membrane protein YkoI
MNKRLKRIIVMGAAVAVLAAGGAAIAIASSGGGDDEDDRPATGAALDRASEAALQHTGGGRVTDSEVGDEEGYYEIEVTLDSGKQVDVHLDRDFNVLSQEGDEEGSGGEARDDD